MDKLIDAAADGRPTAKWIEWTNKAGEHGVFCSRCFTSDRVHKEMNFCPNCGAAMKRKDTK